jgi:DNA-binding GntR family transcriptional regulator
MKPVLGQKIEARSLVDVVAERIEAALLAGALEPGGRLSESALAASLGVSRNAFREAVRLLEGRRLLERVAEIGVRVVAPSLQDLREILLIREALESMACALASTNMSDREIAALAAALDDYEAQQRLGGEGGEPPEFADIAFHERIVAGAGAGNTRLNGLLMGELYYPLRVTLDDSPTGPDRARQALGEHKAIVEALSRRDPTLAELRMREHLANARRFVEARFKRAASLA